MTCAMQPLLDGSAHARDNLELGLVRRRHYNRGGSTRRAGGSRERPAANQYAIPGRSGRANEVDNGESPRVPERPEFHSRNPRHGGVRHFVSSISFQRGRRERKRKGKNTVGYRSPFSLALASPG
jgi:hypothetical protein